MLYRNVGRINVATKIMTLIEQWTEFIVDNHLLFSFGEMHAHFRVNMNGDLHVKIFESREISHFLIQDKDEVSYREESTLILIATFRTTIRGAIVTME